MTDRLNWNVETSNQFNRFQSGLRKLKSCQDDIVRLQDDMRRAIQSKHNLTGVFVDLEKAFDLVWADGLLRNRIRDLLTDRYMRVTVGTTMSDSSARKTVISPVLFIITVNDIR